MRSAWRVFTAPATITPARGLRFLTARASKLLGCYAGKVRPFVWPFALTFATFGLAAPACGSSERPPRFEAQNSAGEAGSGGIRIIDSGQGPPAADASGLCGNQIVSLVQDRPNLYFVLDRSGSMAQPISSSSYSKYTSARVAIAGVLRSIGHRVNYGAAVFPAFNGPGCQVGEEVFPTTAGDPPSEPGTRDGPTLQKFLQILAGYQPGGGTSTSGTLTALTSTLQKLEGRTVVVLATDGAPNCNPDNSCAADRCMLNIEGYVLDGIPCAGAYNCCDPTIRQQGRLDCLDDSAAELAIAELASSGIKTYVVGMPGSELYSSVLSRFAEAGQTARPSALRYFAVGDNEELGAALKQIGNSVAISCDVVLDETPPDKHLVNVYFDTRVVSYGDTDGWTWTGDNTLQIRGARCSELQSGDVAQLQIVAGCQTVVR